MKSLLSLSVAVFFIFASGLTACAKTTKLPAWVTPPPTNAKEAYMAWKDSLPENAWKGDEKVWAKIPSSAGKLIWVSFQNAPLRNPEKTNEKIKKGEFVCSQVQDVNFSVAWRTDKDSHPGESDGRWGHVGIRCYNNLGRQCPPAKGEAWENIIKLISGPMPPKPLVWKANKVYGEWLKSCD